MPAFKTHVMRGFSEVNPVAGAVSGSVGPPEPVEYLKPIPWTTRPTGESEDQYLGWQKWPWRRYAWEFLRRNDRFQSNSNGSNVDIDYMGGADNIWLAQHDPEQGTAKMVAHFYGMTRFKHYSEEYDQGRRPQFQARAVKVFSWLDPAAQQGGDIPPRLNVPVRPGEVAIRFTLLPARLNQGAVDEAFELIRSGLERQLSLARRHVDRLVGIAAEKDLTLEARDRRFTRKGLLRALRLLDLKAGNSSLERVCEVMNTVLTPESAALGSTLAEKVKSHMRFPHELAGHRYLDLAVK